ncbi:hypothetical protein BDZ94DRAFT_803524 [Collybia nuda]|uniref:F-box domain-containing protein n=1 Tax=Collybia nuda TaxID=64659 RepID=A0A9P5Y3L6_9AGAR|nr:hypothetical protein BDZ94DRAFT_803524 [Collybia nuda]
MKHCLEDLNIENLNIEMLHTQTGSGSPTKHVDEGFEYVRRVAPWETPQKHVPPEILGKIFVHCLDGEAVFIPPKASPSMPWLLGQICSRWRTIALEEHQLWDNVVIASCKFFPRLALEEVIRRSGESRIINLNHVPGEYFKIILPTLRRHCNRFQSLEIEITRPTATLLSEMCLFDRLESLEIHYGHALHTPNSDDPSRTEFSAPPSLRKLILSSDISDHLPLNNTRINPAAPFWERLTYLEVKNNTCVPIFTMLHILGQCKALVECSLLLCDDSGSIRDESERVTVPSLQLITAQSVDPILTDFFASLNLPSLRILKMVGLSEPWPQHEILALIDRSGCNLEGFYNADFTMPPECVMPLIRAMPCVAHVSLDTDAPIPCSTIDTIISENLLPYLVFVTAWFDSSHAALKLVETTWARSVSPGGGIRDGVLYIDSADIRADEEACRVLKRVVSQSGGSLGISVC